MSKVSHKRKLIIDYIREHKTITVEQCQSIPQVNTYYCNSAKHCGELLRAMHKIGLIERIKKGTYGIPEKPRFTGSGTIELIDENQQKLF